MLIFQTVNLGKKILKKKIDFFEKITKFFCEILVRKKSKNNLVEIYKPLCQAGAL